MFIERLIGSSAKVKVLRVLAESNLFYSLYDLQRITNLSMGAIHKAVSAFLRESIVTEKKGAGKQRYYQFNTNFVENRYAQTILSLFDIEKQERRRVIPLDVWSYLEDIGNDLVDNVPGLSLIYLVGSIPRGEINIRSEVELLIVGDKDCDSQKVDKTVKKYSRKKVRYVFLREKEFDEKKDTPRYRTELEGSLLLIRNRR